MAKKVATGRRKLIVLGQIPPPYHGQAIAIKLMIEGLQDQLDMIHVPMQFSDTVKENGEVKLKKLFHLFHVIFRTLWLLIRYPGSVLYYPPAPGHWVPVIRDWIILSTLRPFVSKTIFHFHAHGIGKFLRERPCFYCLTWAWRKPYLAIVLGESCVNDAQLLRPKKVAIVPYGISIEPGKRKRVEKKPIRVLYVGMLAESKGLFDLLETAKRFENQELEFRLVGTIQHSETRDKFEKRRTELKLVDQVVTLGQKTGQQLWQEYADADIFFFPTWFEAETFGLVTVEAMLHSLPVVASDWRGPKDIVKDEESGYLCEPRDIDSYANAIQILASNTELRSQMGSAGKFIARSRYDLSNYLSSLKSHFLEAGCGAKCDTSDCIG